jgi:divalent metal cation (Fe/Co/Zn/Cd) transporter
MLGGALILGGDTDAVDGDLNMRAVLLDTAAGGVAIAGAIILAAGGLYWIDPAAALVVSTVVAYHAIRLLQQVAASCEDKPENSPRRAQPPTRPDG